MSTKLSKRYKAWKREQKKLRDWKLNGYALPAPQTVKQHVFKRYAIPTALWVETGTYVGTTTEFLAGNYSYVHTIEPQKEYFDKAIKKFSDKNVAVHHGTSEQIMPILLPQLSGSINFWLDGHYSGGDTYKGDRECPIIKELEAISDNISRLEKFVIFIDDIRCFTSEPPDPGYPNVNFLTDWAGQHDLNWRIEHDIMIMYK